MYWQKCLPASQLNNFSGGINSRLFLLFKSPVPAKYQNIPTNCIIPQVISICQFNKSNLYWNKLRFKY